MTQIFYVDGNGRFLGSYDGPEDSTPDAFKGATIVPTAPSDVSEEYDFKTQKFQPVRDSGEPR